MDNTVQERFKKLLEFLNMNASEFSSKLGYNSPEKIYRIFRNKGENENKPSFDILADISNMFENINIDWIITGKGDMIKNINHVVNEREGIYIVKKNHSKDKVPVPYYDIDFAAGNDIAFIDDNTVHPSYYMDIPEFSGCTAFRVYSDSMEKLIKSGSIVFSTKIEQWLNCIEYGQIYGIIAKDGRRFIKYVRKSTDHEKEFILRSENDLYDDFSILKTSIRSIWLIHGWLHKRV